MKALLRGTVATLTPLTIGLATVLGGALVSSASAAYSDTVTEGWAPNRGVNAIARHGDTIYIGGSFTRLINTETGVGVRRAGAAAIDAITGEVLAWNPDVDGTVHAIGVAPSGTVYLGGDFLTVAGQPAERVAAVRADGTPVPGWSAAASDTVYDVVATETGVIVGGSFGRVNGLARAGVALLDADTGAVDTGFNARVTGGRVRALKLAPDGRTVMLGGSFSALSGESRGFVGSVDVDTGAPTGWAPAPLCDRCHVLDLAEGDGSAYAATAGPGGRAVAWSLTSGAREWLHRGDGDVQAIDYEGGVVYAGGHFGPVFSDARRHQLAAISSRTGRLLRYRLPFTGLDKPGIWAVLADESALRIGGYFSLAGTDQARFGSFPAVVPASAPTQVAATVVDRAVRVTWARPSSDGGAPIERFEVSAVLEGDSAGRQVCTATALACLVPIASGGLTEDSTYHFTVRAVTVAGAGAESDPSNPVTTALGPDVTLAGRRWQAAIGDTTSFTWTGSDRSGVDHYRIDRRATALGQAAGPWVTESSTTSSAAVPLAAGETVCLKVSGVDTAGNEGSESATKCRTAPVDDLSASTKGRASRIAGARFYGGSVTRLTGASSLVRWRNVEASTTQLVASSCPKCGRARVYYGKKLVTTIRLKTATARDMIVYELPRADESSKITIRPASGRKILIDGLVMQPR